MQTQVIQVTQSFPVLEVVSIIISILALASSAYVGYQQVRISQTQVDMQDTVELYLLSQPVILQDANGQIPDKKVPAIFIRNLGKNVIYLENYKYDGKEYPLDKDVIPPVSAYDGFYYIFLPTDKTTHVSIEINFLDWKGRPWITKGFADFKDGIWKLSYEPCKRRDK